MVQEHLPIEIVDALHRFSRTPAGHRSIPVVDDDGPDGAEPICIP